MEEQQTPAQRLLGDFAPKMVQLTDDVLFGDVWKRPGLSPRDRSLVTVAVLAATYRPDQLTSHLRRALANGLTQDELVEALTHLAFYAGWPSGMAALTQLKTIIADTGSAHRGKENTCVTRTFGRPQAARAYSEGDNEMEYTRLGDTGLRISRLALGCMSYGDPTTEGAHRWALADDDAQPFFRQAIELGITFWDTANVYQAGTSEEVTGRAIRRYSRREDIVLATKVFGKMHDGPGGSGLSRKAIMEQIDASLTRLGTDYVDLYQIHRFDPATPAAETMEALHDVVKAGKVRYLGASSMYAWQFAKLQHAAGQGGWTRFVSMQNQYNLLRRQDEPELMAMCADTGVGLVPYSPQGKGRLARPWGEQSTRSSVDHVVQAFDSPLDEPVVHAVQALAGARGVTMAQVALAWVLRNPAVSAPIVGATKPHHLPEATAALELKLTDDEAAALEKPYSNHGPSWY